MNGREGVGGEGNRVESGYFFLSSFDSGFDLAVLVLDNFTIIISATRILAANIFAAELIDHKAVKPYKIKKPQTTG